LRGARKIPAQFDPFWAGFMVECDAVKYAGRAPGAGQFTALLAAARSFVEKSR